MNVEQISIFLENKPGRLEEVTRIFEGGGSTSGRFPWPTRPSSGSCA